MSDETKEIAGVLLAISGVLLIGASIGGAVAFLVTAPKQLKINSASMVLLSDASSTAYRMTF